MSKIYFIPHGGGPMPVLGDPGYAGLASMLRGLHGELSGAKAIILITAHWEEERPSLSTAPQPGMLYDYHGFPPEAYELQYPASGAPKLATKVADALWKQEFNAAFDPMRGFDHGTFIPMMLMRPEADIPVLQMSLLASLDPEEHLKLGEALAQVLDDDVVLIGSGFSFHNIGALVGRLGGEIAQGQEAARLFHSWLDDTICNTELSLLDRYEQLIYWWDAPGARFCHPREEHLLPVHVCAGAGNALGLKAEKIFSEPVKGFQTSGYRWS